MVASVSDDDTVPQPQLVNTVTVQTENDPELYLEANILLRRPNGSTYNVYCCLPKSWFRNMYKALTFKTNAENKITYMARTCRWNYISPEIKNNLVDCYEYYVREDFENALITVLRLKRYYTEAIVFMYYLTNGNITFKE